mgnify:CR=1 FL=1
MYELMVVGKVEGADSLFDRVEKMLKDADASSLKVEKLGKKQLAYAIKKQTEAEYFLFNFEVDSQAISAFSDMLRLDQDSVLRYVILKTKISKPRKHKKSLRVSANVEEASTSDEAVKSSKVEKKITAVKKVVKSKVKK